MERIVSGPYQNGNRAACGAILLLCATACTDPSVLEEEWSAFGEPARARVYATTERAAREILDRMVEAVGVTEATMSFRGGGELARLNAVAAEEAYRVRERDLYRCIRLALDYAKASEGAFDPTVGPLKRLYEGGRTPSDEAIDEALGHVGWRDVVMESEAVAVRFRREGIELDLGGMAQGYALDVAARNFAIAGSRSGVLRLGDQLYTWRAPPGEPYARARINDPRDRSRSIGTLLLSSRGVAVSSAESGWLDPGTGRPPSSDVLVALAVADSAADAAAVSAALLVGGSQRAGKLLSATRRVEAVLVVRGVEGPRAVLSTSLRERFEPSKELEQEVGGRYRFLLPPRTLERFEGL